MCTSKCTTLKVCIIYTTHHIFPLSLYDSRLFTTPECGYLEQL